MGTNTTFETPLYELYQDASGNRIFIKRDDLLPFSLGGNKVRIAEAFLEDMERKGCDVMIGYGDLRSNLCRVLANRCFQKKIPCYIICTGGDGTGHGETANSWLMKLSGAVLVPCLKTEIAETVDRITGQLKARGHRPYYIYGNRLGRGNEGTAAGAYAPVYREILEQGRRQNVDFDCIFLPSGTGATQSGLVCGQLLQGDRAEIIGISVSRDRERGTEIIREGVESYFRKEAMELPADAAERIHLEDGYRKGGYGCYDEEILGCIREVFLRYGVPMDPTYTGKAFLGMRRYLKEHGIRGCRVLFLHTGGAPLFYDAVQKGILNADRSRDTEE